MKLFSPHDKFVATHNPQHTVHKTKKQLPRASARENSSLEHILQFGDTECKNVAKDRYGVMFNI